MNRILIDTMHVADSNRRFLFRACAGSREQKDIGICICNYAHRIRLKYEG